MRMKKKTSEKLNEQWKRTWNNKRKITYEGEKEERKDIWRGGKTTPFPQGQVLVT